jgi:hypothetical protein
MKAKRAAEMRTAAAVGWHGMGETGIAIGVGEFFGELS